MANLVITDIKLQVKRENRCSIYINGEFVFGLSDVDVLFYKLKIGDTISEDKYNEIIDNVLLNSAKNTALKFLSTRMRSEQEVRKKLEEKEFGVDVVDKVITFLENYKYIDDVQFAKTYSRDRLKVKGHGIKKIKYDLKMLGVQEEIIDEILSEEEAKEMEYEKAYSQAFKKAKNLDINDIKDKKKLNDFMLRRGYNYDIIVSVMKDLADEYDIIEDYDDL